MLRSLIRCQSFLVPQTRQSSISLCPKRNFQARIPPSNIDEIFCHRSFSSDNDYYHDLGPNPGLASVIAQGIKSLEETATDVEARTKNKSIQPKSDHPTNRQLAEAQRILEVATDCLEDLLHKAQNPNSLQGLHLQGQPIVLLDVIVNKDVKQAKVYWTLPYSVLLDPNVTQRVYQKLVMVVQDQLLNEGGAKLLARQVSSRLRFYYPPRIRMVPAKHAMIQQAIEEFHE